ncbi:MAG: hypothetical protein KGY38_04820 [Desulfobacterales bacterium]|nr:hypothetical protein [Desulfobacterales bacterium]
MLGVLREGIDDGSMRSDIRAEKLMFILWGTAFGLLEGLISRINILQDIYESSPDELYSIYIDLIADFVSGNKQ